MLAALVEAAAHGDAEAASVLAKVAAQTARLHDSEQWSRPHLTWTRGSVPAVQPLGGRARQPEGGVLTAEQRDMVAALGSAVTSRAFVGTARIVDRVTSREQQR